MSDACVRSVDTTRSVEFVVRLPAAVGDDRLAEALEGPVRELLRQLGGELLEGRVEPLDCPEEREEPEVEDLIARRVRMVQERAEFIRELRRRGLGDREVIGRIREYDAAHPL